MFNKNNMLFIYLFNIPFFKLAFQLEDNLLFFRIP